MCFPFSRCAYVAVLTWAIYCLCQHTEAQEKLAEEARRVLGDDGAPTPDTLPQLTYTKQVVDEVLRWSVLAPWAGRYYDDDHNLGDYTIPAEVSDVILHDVVDQSHPSSPLHWSLIQLCTTCGTNEGSG